MDDVWVYIVDVIYLPHLIDLPKTWRGYVIGYDPKELEDLASKWVEIATRQLNEDTRNVGCTASIRSDSFKEGETLPDFTGLELNDIRAFFGSDYRGKKSTAGNPALLEFNGAMKGYSIQ